MATLEAFSSCWGTEADPRFEHGVRPWLRALVEALAGRRAGRVGLVPHLLSGDQPQREAALERGR